MRVTATPARGFEAKSYSGTHTVLVALNCTEERRKGLTGFAFEREMIGPGGTGPKWLRSQKVFKSIVPDPKNALDPNDPKKRQRFDTKDFPIQSFLWGDYGAAPDTAYRFRILPMYGKPGALTSDPQDELRLEIKTEKEWEEGASHGVWFNRGAIASQKFAEEFGNAAPKNIDDPTDPEVVWLSRGLLEACLNYIRETPAGDGLRVAAYEFTYAPILNELKRAIERGVDVQIAYHDTSDAPGQPNETALQTAGLPVNDQKTTFRRSRTKIPHNKFIVRLKGGTDPVEVWTGSTNFTASGFLGQTNVGHRVADSATAKQYFEYWKLVKTDPELAGARDGAMALTPNPAEVISERSIVRLFSPRKTAELLGWYGRRMLDSANSVWFTAAFGVTAELVDPIAERRDQMRFVFFVHTKFLLIDPLSDDPLVCSGSANFSPDSLLENDENMLLIRGDTRVADIYMTEFDRVFRHFYFRDIANELAAKGDEAAAIFLDETDGWTDSYFKPNSVKANRRLMFFGPPKTTWFANAATR